MDTSVQSQPARVRTKNRTYTTDNTSLAFGKIPPQNVDLEEAILGAMLSEKSASEIGLEYLREECFYKETHRIIFKAMMSLTIKKLPIDLYTVSDELKNNSQLETIGGTYHLALLTNKIASTAHIESWVKIILEKFIQRELIRISSEVIHDAYEPDANVFELMNSAESKLFDITNNFVKKNYQKVSDALVEVVNRIETVKTQKSDLTGVTTGFTELDEITNGWQKTDLIIVAARPGLGKTAFALNLVQSAAMNPIKPVGVAFFSLEMSTGQLVERLLSAQSEIRLDFIKKGKLDDEGMQRLYEKGIAPMSEAPIYIDDTSALNIFELRSKCKKLVSHHHVGLVIIDYIQLMSGGSDGRNFNREQEISKISRELKSLAKELDIPIIALSQLNRNTEGRGKEGSGKRPMLSDLRESGAIEQDADMVILMYRGDYYGITQNEHGDNVKGLTEIIIAKHRNGNLGTVNLKAILELQKFKDWEQNQFSSLSPFDANATNFDPNAANNFDIPNPISSAENAPQIEIRKVKSKGPKNTNDNDIDHNDTDAPPF